MHEMGWKAVLVAVAYGSVCALAAACGTEAPDARGSTAGGGAGVGDIGGLAGSAGLQGLPVGGNAGGAAGTGVGVAGTAGGVAGAPAAPVSDIPCDVAKVVTDNCGRCHGAMPQGGAMRLITHADWHQASPFYGPTRLMDSTKQVYEIAQLRINNGEMPQGRQMAAADLAMLDTWLRGGAVAAAPGDTCATPTLPPPEAGSGGTAGAVAGAGGTVAPPVGPSGTIDNCTKPGAFDSLQALPGETCHEFPVHAPGGSGAFSVPANETYHEWYYAVPWGPTDVWTRFGADFDNLPVLHHYLVFTSSAGRQPGAVATNVTGTTLGTNATLIGGWAVGGCNTIMPDGVGGDIPESPLLMVQWHMYNTTGRPQQDASVVKVCTVAAGSRSNVAGITFLGTENFNSIFGMPAGENHFTTRCTNNSGGPITVLGFTPHMHLIGSNMKTDLISGGNKRTIFDMPFKFDYQVGYEIPPATVMPGETLETTCSFFNDTGANVAFGESTTSEMCYQFTLTYPVGALNNGAPSLIGALNTCW